MKVLYLLHPAHKYLQVILALSNAGRVDSTGVVGWQELYLLQSMVDCRSIHLGHVLADFLAHQGQHVRLRTIFTGPYVT